MCIRDRSSLGDDLKFVFICSAVTVVRSDSEQLQVRPLEHAKCERCWHVRADVGAQPGQPGLCGRCIDNLFGSGEVRHHA